MVLDRFECHRLRDRARGHGLGLSILRRTVEELGGQVAVESRPGEEACFALPPVSPVSLDTGAPQAYVLAVIHVP
ncbi:MAG: ATP-binding protein [Acidobacteriota bacterium]